MPHPVPKQNQDFLHGRFAVLLLGCRRIFGDRRTRGFEIADQFVGHLVGRQHQVHHARAHTH